MRPYREEIELTRYVWNHFSSFMTDFESRVGRHILLQEKAAASRGSDEHRRRLITASEPELAAALPEGAEEFRYRTCRRVLAEHGAEIFVNRCPVCHRVVATPGARQCLWCGFDSHARVGD